MAELPIEPSYEELIADLKRQHRAVLDARTALRAIRESLTGDTVSEETRLAFWSLGEALTERAKAIRNEIRMLRIEEKYG
jgi:hypothetical protein